MIARLRKEILHLEGFKVPFNKAAFTIVPGAIGNAFPNAVFPLGAIHEFICTGLEDTAATSGFIAGMLGALMQSGGACIWINSCRTVFPPALKAFGITPDNIIFIEVQKEKEILWVTEEALRYDGLVAVVAEVKELAFTASRRLQLAVEQSRVTGFIIHKRVSSLPATACISRWKITSVPSEAEEGMPGVGFPRWNVQLLKVRNGKPGRWQVEFSGRRLKHIPDIRWVVRQQRKTG